MGLLLCGVSAFESHNQHVQGNRLGSADEARAQQTPLVNHHADESLPEPIHNPNLTDTDREQQRADRLAAVEARMKGKQPKKPKKTSEPLRGPNSKNTMQWNV